MRYLMVIWADADRARRWQALSPAERDAEAAPIHAWFESSAAGGRIQFGAEIAWPRERLVASRGPDGSVVRQAAETASSVLSGVMVVEVAEATDAHELARTWPDLRDDGDAVELFPLRDFDEP